MIDIEVTRLIAGDRVILQDFVAHTDDASILILGGVGTGKSLLARAICGDFQEQSWIKVTGDVTLQSTKIALGRRTEPLSRRIAYLPQRPTGFFVTLSVRSEFELVHLCNSANHEAAQEALLESLKNTKFQESLEHAPSSLSGGQQRLLMLELVLASMPDHLVIDGGLGCLDLESKKLASRMISNWKEQDNDRSLVCFDNGLDQISHLFSLVVTLGPAESEGHVALRKYEQTKQCAPLLEYENIVAGPIVGGDHLISGFDLKIKVGECVGLIGRNGVGKTTLLRLIAGINRPVQGRILFKGQEIGNTAWPGLLGGVAYLPQEPELAGPLLFGFKYLAATDNTSRNTEFDYWINFFGLSKSLSLSNYWFMSVGERSAFALAKLASQEPACFILDEPTTGLDRDTVGSFVNAARSRYADLSFLIVSHDREFLDTTCDRIVQLTKQVG